MAANNVAQALSGLTQYLFTENSRLDAENKEKRINLAAESIAEAYQKLPPDATISDVQKLQYQLVDQAAALGGLQENLPLISSLYQSTVGIKQYEKAERQDANLYGYIKERYGMNVGDISGNAALGLAGFQRAGQERLTTTDADNISSSTKFDEFGQPMGDPIVINAVSFGVQWDWQKKQMDYQYSQQLGAIKFKHGLDMTAAGLSGQASSPQFAGFDLYTGTQGVGGETLYKHHKNGGTYFLDRTTGQVKPYWGDIQKISGKGQMSQIKDVLSTLQENQDTFQPQRLGLIQSLTQLDDAGNFLEQLTGASKLPQDQNDQYTMGAVTALDNALLSPGSPERLQKAYDELDAEEQARVGPIMQQYNSLLSNQVNIDNLIKSNMPQSQYDGPGLVTAEEYERGSEGLFQIFSGKVPAQVSAPVRSYIAKIAGIDVGSVNETLFRSLGRKDQEKVMQGILPYINYTK